VHQGEEMPLLFGVSDAVGSSKMMTAAL